MRALCHVAIVSFLLFSMMLLADEFALEPPQNFVLNPKYIALHHPVQTTSHEAQLYFDQGLSFIYAFNHEAAYWSFLRASTADPNMAMAHWGMALTVGMNINASITPERSKVASDAIQKAAQLASQENERAYIQALAKRYSADPKADQKKLAQDYSDEMAKVTVQYPDDLDAATLYAESILDLDPWAQWTLEGKPLNGTMKAVRTLESVLKRDPNHLGANHYFIHAVEASSHPEIALMCAERLKTLLPSSGHILHMSSHIFMMVGDYHQAALSNEAALAADRAYIRNYGVRGNYPVHYMTHNYYVLFRAYTMEGRCEIAKAITHDLTEFYVPHFRRMPELEYYATAPLSVLITFHRWEELLKMEQPPEEMKVYSVLWRFGRALAFAKLGNVAKAQEERALFLKGKDNLLPSDISFGYNRASKVLLIAQYCLDGQLAEAQGQFSQAIDFIDKAVKEQDTLRYNEPPDWFFPVRETLGGIYLRAHDPAKAEKVFREELQRHPRNGRALFGLRESLKEQSKLSDYYWINVAFQNAWMYSDIQLTIDSL